jgi:hypothetical protein
MWSIGSLGDFHQTEGGVISVGSGSPGRRPGRSQFQGKPSSTGSSSGSGSGSAASRIRFCRVGRNWSARSAWPRRPGTISIAIRTAASAAAGVFSSCRRSSFDNSSSVNAAAAARARSDSIADSHDAR